MGKKQPKPTDPRETSAAQTGSNVGTAIANAFMQNPTEYGPDGSTRVDQTGTYNYYDSYTGQSYAIPTFTRTTTLSPAQQAIKAQTDAAELNLGSLANQQSAKLNQYLSNPFDPSSIDAPSLTTDFSADRQRVEDALFTRLNTRLDQDRSALETQLANQGIRIGSTAYDRAMNQFGQNVNDARTSAILNAGQEQSRLTQLNNATRGQAMQEAFATRNQPINEITALLSGSQVSAPQFMGANVGPIPTTDNAGIIAQYDAQRQQAANSANSFTSNIFGGLFGLGGKLIGLSDDDAKKDKRRLIDLDDDGTGLWEFRYKGEDKDSPKHIGLMASEVEKVDPGAVLDGYADGYRRVDYGRAISSIIGGA